MGLYVLQWSFTKELQLLVCFVSTAMHFFLTEASTSANHTSSQPPCVRTPCFPISFNGVPKHMLLDRVPALILNNQYPHHNHKSQPWRTKVPASINSRDTAPTGPRTLLQLMASLYSLLMPASLSSFITRGVSTHNARFLVTVLSFLSSEFCSSSLGRTLLKIVLLLVTFQTNVFW